MKQLAKRFGTSQQQLRAALESALVTYMNQVPHDVDLRGLTVWFASQDPAKFPQRQLTTEEKLRMLELVQSGETVGAAERIVRGQPEPERPTAVGRVAVRPATMTQYFTDAEIEELDQIAVEHSFTPQKALDYKFPDMFLWSDT